MTVHIEPQAKIDRTTLDFLQASHHAQQYAAANKEIGSGKKWI
jgi:hypothetical protein